MGTTTSGVAGWLAAVAASVIGWAAAAPAAPAEISIPGDRVFPESITAAKDGAIYIGSVGRGMIFKVAPGSPAAEPFVAPGPDLMSVTGVVADDVSKTLYACSNDWSGYGITTPGGNGPPALKAFDLATGKVKGSYTFPGGNGFCNDIAVGRDGAAYVTDSLNPRVLRLTPKSGALEVWLEDEIFGTTGANLNGIAFGADGDLYVTGYTANKLYRIAVNKAMKPGAISELTLSSAVANPDGMRPERGAKGTRLLLVEGDRLNRVTISGDKAEIVTLKSGLAGGVSVTQTGNTAWVLEGQMSFISDPNLKGQTPAPFKAHAVSLGGDKAAE